MRQKLIDAFLDYTNNFLTVEGFSQFLGVNKTQALAIITLGKELHESKHTEE